MTYNRYRNNHDIYAQPTFYNGNWRMNKSPTRPEGCIAYWFMMITGVFGIITALISDPPPNTDKCTYVAYMVAHLAIAHVYFSYMCHINKPGSGYNTAFTVVTLVLWFFIWIVVVPQWMGIELPFSPVETGGSLIIMDEYSD